MTHELWTLEQQQATHAPDTSYDNDPAAEWEALIRARLLLLMGYATFIVEIETGLTPKRIRKIRNDLEAEGVTCSSPRSSKRASSKSLIKNRHQQQHASILMGLYTSLHDGYAQDTDPLILGTAYGLFLGAMEGIGIKCEPAAADDADESTTEERQRPQELMSINEAWVFAAELRAREGAMIECIHCGTSFYEAIHQHYLGEQPCPWCG